MSPADLRNGVEIIVALSLLGALFSVALQIRTHTRSVRSASRTEAAGQIGAWQTALAQDSELSRIRQLGLRSPEELDPDELSRFDALMGAYFSHVEAITFQNRESSEDPNAQHRWTLVLRRILATPGGREFWSRQGWGFEESFQRYVESDCLVRAAENVSSEE